MHFKSDWHCENLRRKEQGHQILSRSMYSFTMLPYIIIIKFEINDFKFQLRSISFLLPGDELTSSSAEEQDEEEGEEDDDDGKEDENPTTLDTHNNRLAKLFFENKSGELFSFYKVIVLKKKV